MYFPLLSLYVALSQMFRWYPRMCLLVPVGFFLRYHVDVVMCWPMAVRRVVFVLCSPRGLPWCGECLVCTNDFVGITLSYTVQQYNVIFLHIYLQGIFSLRLKFFRAILYIIFSHERKTVLTMPLIAVEVGTHISRVNLTFLLIWTPASYTKRNHRVGVLENRVLRLPGSKGDEVAGGWKI